MVNKVLIDRSVVEQALEALEHHVEQTRPIYKTTMAIEALIAALEQPQVEQSSVVGVIGWKNHLPNSGTVVHWTALMPPLGTKLYTNPQPPRQPLTDDDIERIWEDWCRSWTGLEQFETIVRMVEKHHGITGEQE